MTGTPTAAVGAALLVFLWVGLRARTADTTLDAYLTARGSQSALTLGLSFLASGLGAWILFVPPEIGAFVGPVALTGSTPSGQPCRFWCWHGVARPSGACCRRDAA
ncbi:hypothetical protein [Tepidimonas sp.]|uniref:hypothetical protein n=1 Tax=Tepidimonas sp. TaxID=2002775 RepID=UPI002FE2B516